MTVDLPVPRRALAIGAHPDDVEFGCGATLAKWSAAGARVHIAVLTNGEKGTWDADADLTHLVARRQREQRDAAEVLGASDVHFLGFTDGELRDGLAERRALCAVIREVQPDVVLGHDPWKPYRLHPDHRYAGFLTIDAVVAARDPHFFPDLSAAPHRPHHLLLFEAAFEDHLEGVDTHLSTKVTALLCHRSQWRSTMRILAGSPDESEQRQAFVERVVNEARAAARRVTDAAGVEAAEVFKRIDDL